MTAFATLPDDERRSYITQAASELGILPVLVEKDFWVCWAVRAVFSNGVLAPHVVFKGGTSLSKVYHAIDRFSEDINLSLAPGFVGADLASLDSLPSRGARDAALKRLQGSCGVKVRDSIRPILESMATDELGERRDGEPWFGYEFDQAAASPNLLFHYPAMQVADVPYIPPAVKLEFGSLTDQQPVGQHAITPLVVSASDGLLDERPYAVTALDLPRSFWEKATILHGEHYRPDASNVPDRYARHYSDVARLVAHPDAATFLHDRELCARVASWKQRWFPRAWARYDLARHGTFRLAPRPERLPALAADYASMKPMFLADPPPFEAVLAALTDAEDEINRL